MAYNRTQVRSLLNATELDIFELSLAVNVKSLTAAQLRGKIVRTRTLRDKYVDLLRRQKIATRGRTGSKTGATGLANQRTEEKSVVLAEVLGRFEKRMQEIDNAQTRLADAASAKAARSAPKRESKARSTDAPVKTAAPGKTAKLKTAAKPPAATKTAGAMLRGLLEKKRANGANEPAIRAARSKKAPATVPTSDPSGIGPTGESAARAVKQQSLTGGQRIQGHVAAQARRTQAKRDKRG